MNWLFCFDFISDHIDIIEMLIHAGAEIDIKDDNGWTPYCRAKQESTVDAWEKYCIKIDLKYLKLKWNWNLCELN